MHPARLLAHGMTFAQTFSPTRRMVVDFEHRIRLQRRDRVGF